MAPLASPRAIDRAPRRRFAATGTSADAPASRRWSGEVGTSPVTALFSVAIFLGFLLVAVQVLVHLYTTSVVTTAAFEAARLVAAAEPAGRAAAEAHATALLGGYGGQVSFDWSGSGADEVVVRITGPSPAVLIRAVGQLAGLDSIDRQVRVRVERFVEEP